VLRVGFEEEIRTPGVVLPKHSIQKGRLSLHLWSRQVYSTNISVTAPNQKMRDRPTLQLEQSSDQAAALRAESELSLYIRVTLRDAVQAVLNGVSGCVLELLDDVWVFVVDYDISTVRLQ